MDNYITCPNCKKTIANHELIESAAKGENLGSSVLICECGERITFWAITAQLREQKKLGTKIKNWLRGLSKKNE